MSGTGKPGRYQEILDWLAGHSPATVNDIGYALGLTRSRVLLVLRTARSNGDVRGEPFSGEQLYPVQWSCALAEQQEDEVTS